MRINEERESQNFDKQAEYTAEIIPIMHQLEEACERIGLPYVVHVVFREDDCGVGSGTLMSNCGKQGIGGHKVACIGAMAAGKIGPSDILAAAVAAVTEARKGERG